MTPEVAIQKREQMIEEGFCIVDNVLTEEFLQELRDESERLIAGHVEPEDVIYQGQHVNVRGEDNTHIQKLLEWQPSREALEQIGFGDFVSSGGIIILTKESGGPPLYWHQDWMRWNDPLSCAPWPQTIFLNYYLTDTDRENGCLKVIPGTHRKRIDLHDILVPAHEQGARFIDEDHPIMFSDHPDQVDICAKAGSLVMADARILHSAHRNFTDVRRTLILAWHSRPNTVPDYWDREIPEVVASRDEDANYPMSRIPGDFLQP
ncbi:phytanoyl-CoA dioxygenase family protein [Candidatus Poribacteria bacterium]|nr:phytanoyl-CoA dioxygenase family protein [Candidatus Poribacteria bacterium]MYA57545.1 phytanoyl-CoA dioxygenase family protein [Candidatus Poribacteria bacterium]